MMQSTCITPPSPLVPALLPVPWLTFCAHACPLSLQLSGQHAGDYHMSSELVVEADLRDLEMALGQMPIKLSEVVHRMTTEVRAATGALGCGVCERGSVCICVCTSGVGVRVRVLILFGQGDLGVWGRRVKHKCTFQTRLGVMR